MSAQFPPLQLHNGHSETNKSTLLCYYRNLRNRKLTFHNPVTLTFLVWPTYTPPVPSASLTLLTRFVSQLIILCCLTYSRWRGNLTLRTKYQFVICKWLLFLCDLHLPLDSQFFARCLTSTKCMISSWYVASKCTLIIPNNFFYK